MRTSGAGVKAFVPATISEKDGHTKQSLAKRTFLRHRRNKVAKQSRKRNR